MAHHPVFSFAQCLETDQNPALLFASYNTLGTFALCKQNAAFKSAMPAPMMTMEGTAAPVRLLSLLLFAEGDPTSFVQPANAAATIARLCKNMFFVRKNTVQKNLFHLPVADAFFYAKEVNFSNR